MSISTALTLIGFVSMLTGIGLQFGLGWALLIGGALAFIAGGVGSAREAR